MGQTNRKGAALFDYTVLSGATLSDCAKAFARHGVNGSPGYVYRTIQNLGHAIAEMGAGELKAHELRKQHVRALAEMHVKAGHQATARHRHGSLGRFYRWMQSVDAVEDNPVARVQAPPPPAPRTNVPSAQTVRAVWDAAARLPAARGAFVRLALLVPLRRQELANLKAGNILLDGPDCEIRLSSNQTKNKKPFTMPLAGTAAAIVRELLARTSSPRDPLIPLTRHGAIFGNWGRFGEQLAREAGLSFRWHDTRRLFASELAEHGVANFGTIDALLNHQRSASLGGVARSYHHAAENAARRSTMAAWDRILLHAAARGTWPRQAPDTEAPANVLPLVSGKAG